MDYRDIYELLKSPSETEKFLADPKKTATALLSIKYDILEPRDSSLSYSLVSLCHLLSIHHSAWSVIEQPLLDQITLIAGNEDAPVNVVCPALSILGLIALEARSPSRVSENSSACTLTKSFLSSSDSKVMSTIVARLSSGNVQLVDVTLQVLNCLLIGMVLPESKPCYIYSEMRFAGLWKHLSGLIENRSVTSACRTHLSDMQVLLKAVITKTRNLKVEISDDSANTSGYNSKSSDNGDYDDDNAYYKQLFAKTGECLASFVGTDKDRSETNWFKAGIPVDVEPIDFFNRYGGWASVLDFYDFMNFDNHTLKKQYLEHIAFADPNDRFPLAKASISVSQILAGIFSIDKSIPEGASGDLISHDDLLNGVSDHLVPPEYIPGTRDAFPISASKGKRRPSGPGSPSRDDKIHGTSPVGYRSASSAKTGPVPKNSEASIRTDSSSSSLETFMKSLDTLRPLFFDWLTLHFAGVSNFMRLWMSSNAKASDFENIEQLVKLLLTEATKPALESSSSSAIETVMAKLDTVAYDKLRASQMTNVETDLKDIWGEDISKLHKQYMLEAHSFVQEQRSRLLLSGDWFFADDPTTNTLQSTTLSSNPSIHASTDARHHGPQFYYICLSPSRKTLQYNIFTGKSTETPASDMLTRSVDLSNVTKVVVTNLSGDIAKPKNLKRVSLQHRIIYAKIQLVGSGGSRSGSALTFYADTPEKASAWSDGLLMLRNKAYQSDDTKKYIEMFADTKLKLQMLSFGAEDHKIAKDLPKPDMTDFENGTVGTDFYYQYP